MEVSVARFDRRTAAAGHPNGIETWLVDLDHEARPAILSDGEEKFLEIPPLEQESRFEVGFGVDPAVEGRVAYEVAISEGAEGAEEWVALIRGEWDGKENMGWLDVGAELAASSVSRVIRLRVSRSEAWDSIVGGAYWSSPLIRQTLEEPSRREGLPNIALVIVDTLRADRMSVYGHSIPTTPTLERWMEQKGAFVYENAITTAPWTLPSHASIFTGLGALDHGLNYGQAIPLAASTLAEKLQDAGYWTMAVTGGVYLHPSYGMAQGFDRFSHWPPDSDMDLELEEGLRTVSSWLEESVPKPFFLVFHTYEVHAPYSAREPYFSNYASPDSLADFGSRIRLENDERTSAGGFRARRWLSTQSVEGKRRPLNDSEWQNIRDLYDSSIAFTDERLGLLLDSLYESEGPDGTMVIITSDHGEALGEYGGLADHQYLEDFNIHVPLMISLPGAGPGAHRVARQVSTIDIVPTVLEAIAVEGTGSVGENSLLSSRSEISHSGTSEAWSYAGSSGRGISLRVDNRLKLIFDNGAWAPPNREAEYIYVDGEEHPARLENGERKAKLRQRIEEYYEARILGVRMSGFNKTSTPVEIRVSAKGVVNPLQSKALHSFPGELIWDAPSQQLVARLEANSEFTMFFESTKSDPVVEVELVRSSIGFRCEETAVLEVGSPWVLSSQSEGGCQVRVDEEVGPTGDVQLQLEVSAPLFGSAREPELDHTLKNRLEALGYTGG